MSNFADSQEAAFRRVIRAEIKRGPFTKSQRDVILAFFNHWFHHKSGPKRVVHPGRKKLAKRAGVSIPTVKRTLALLRDHGVITAVAHLEGRFGKATEYRVDTIALSELCAKKKAALPVNGGSNDPGHGGVKMIPRISNVLPFPSQERKTSEGGV